MELEVISGQTDLYIKELGIKTTFLEQENMNGTMVEFIKDNG